MIKISEDNSSKKDNKYFAYMLICSDNTIYSGFSTDLQKRVDTHNRGKGAKYTRSRLPVRLAYWEEFSEKSDALKREYAFKKMKRSQKLLLIENFNYRVES